MDVHKTKNMFDLAIDWSPGVTSFDDESKVRFEPQLYLQRYGILMRILETAQWTNEFHKVGV